MLHDITIKFRQIIITLNQSSSIGWNVLRLQSLMVKTKFDGHIKVRWSAVKCDGLPCQCPMLYVTSRRCHWWLRRYLFKRKRRMVKINSNSRGRSLNQGTARTYKNKMFLLHAYKMYVHQNMLSLMWNEWINKSMMNKSRQSNQLGLFIIY